MAPLREGSKEQLIPQPTIPRQEKGKTVSRLLDDETAEPCRRAVDNFHEFLAIIARVKKIGLELAELESDPLK